MAPRVFADISALSVSPYIPDRVWLGLSDGSVHEAVLSGVSDKTCVNAACAPVSTVVVFRLQISCTSFQQYNTPTPMFTCFYCEMPVHQANPRLAHSYTTAHRGPVLAMEAVSVAKLLVSADNDGRVIAWKLAVRPRPTLEVLVVW